MPPKKEGQDAPRMGCRHAWQKVPSRSICLRPVRTVKKGRLAADKIDGDVYLSQILSVPLKVAVAWAKASGREPIALEDRAGPQKMKGFVEERARYDIVNVKHPGASPDLNALENCWAWVKTRIKRQPGHPSNRDNLWAAVQKAWDDLPQSIVDGWIDDSEARRVEVVAKRGKHTKF